jgi:Zn-dependent metalloprotease
MENIHHPIRGVIPDYMLSRIAEHGGDSHEHASATLEVMSALAIHRGIRAAAAATQPAPPKKHRNVFDALHQLRLPGKLVMSEGKRRSSDVMVTEAYDGAGATWDFLESVFGWISVDGRGKRLDSTVHYGNGFCNAFWDGEQMIYGDGDGRIFNPFTRSLDVIAHEHGHGVIQYTAGLGYTGQTGAINEHLADVIGIMVRQWRYAQKAIDSLWIIGAELLNRLIKGKGLRSMAAPGTAYDDPILGRDPQPATMRDYVLTTDDNGGVHINSGIPNHAFYLAAIDLGGFAWDTVGRVWFVTLKERLRPDADFNDLARATVDVAGEEFGNNGKVQLAIAKAWAAVGLPVQLLATKPVAGTGPLSTFKPARSASNERHRPVIH